MTSLSSQRMLMGQEPRCLQKGDYRGKQLTEINKWKGGLGVGDTVLRRMQFFSLRNCETRGRLLRLLQSDDVEGGACWKWTTHD